MTAEMAVEIFRSMLSVALIMTLPVLLPAMFIGIGVSLLQAVTSIQEQTLSFVPKLFGVAFVLMFLAFWFVEKIVTFTTEIFTRISGMAG